MHRVILALTICLAAAGCRSIHQVPASQTHGVLIITGRPQPPEGAVVSRQLKAIDRTAYSVSGRVRCRVKPGRHRVVFSQLHAVDAAGEPIHFSVGTLQNPGPQVTIAGDRKKAAGAGPRAVWQRKDISFIVDVAAGKTYVLDGYDVREAE